MNEKENPYKKLINEKQIETVKSISNLDDGKLYFMNYVADYKLNKLLKSNVTDLNLLIKFVENELLNNKEFKGENTGGDIDAGCSSFVARTPDDHIILCRNFDYKMDMTAVMMKTSPNDGYESMGMVDTGWITDGKRTLYGIGSLDDGKTDLSMTMAFPYLIMDGMNEKGLAICVLKLEGAPTRQNTGKEKITTTSAMRMVLDKAANVGEALELLQNYDMESSLPEGNFHFQLVDIEGNSVVLEYCKNAMTVLKKNYVTNFYLANSMNGLGHGYDRYKILEAVLSFREDTTTDLKPLPRMSKHEAMSLLELVSQEETEDTTSMTQWSVIYDLTEYSAIFNVRREYDNQFIFNGFVKNRLNL